MPGDFRPTHELLDQIDNALANSLRPHAQPARHQIRIPFDAILIDKRNGRVSLQRDGVEVLVASMSSEYASTIALNGLIGAIDINFNI